MSDHCWTQTSSNSFPPRHYSLPPPKAINDFPDEEKEAYLQAQKQCLELFANECNPLKFLVYNRLDIWKTARQILVYWTNRKNLFKERAHLPMSMTGSGALNKQGAQTCDSVA